MLRNALYLVLAAATLSTHVKAQEAHGEGLEDTVMGPVAFLWPDNRVWSADAENHGPCGSDSGVVNRTEFPLSGGSVALSIADDAWMVAFNIAYDNDPTTQSEFQSLIVGNVSEIVPGHQCYRTPNIPSSVSDGTNATIQLEYWSNDADGGHRNESFFACADITFVTVQDFTIQIPCFNVTASDFITPTETAPAQSTQTVIASSDSGLTTGQKAGIAVGCILGAALIVGAAVFFAFRRKGGKDGQLETGRPSMGESKLAASVHSGGN